MPLCLLLKLILSKRKKTQIRTTLYKYYNSFSGQGFFFNAIFKMYNSILMRTDLPIHLTKSARYSSQSKRMVNASRNLTNPLRLYVWTSQSWTLPHSFGNIHGNEIKHLFNVHKTNVQPLQQTILYIQNPVRMKKFIYQMKNHD